MSQILTGLSVRILRFVCFCLGAWYTAKEAVDLCLLVLEIPTLQRTVN